MKKENRPIFDAFYEMFKTDKKLIEEITGDNTNKDGLLIKIWNFVMEHEEKIEVFNEYFTNLVEQPACLFMGKAFDYLKNLVSNSSTDKENQEEDNKEEEKKEEERKEEEMQIELTFSSEEVKKAEEFNDLLSQLDKQENKERFLEPFISSILGFFLPDSFCSSEENKGERKFRKRKKNFEDILDSSKRICIKKLVNEGKFFDSIKEIFFQV